MLSTSITRRDLLVAAGALVAAPAGARTVGAPGGSAARTRLVLLGTAGGPTPKLHRAAPAAAVVVDDRVYLVDFGDGVARQLTLARLPFTQLRAAFITHHHSDHNAGYGSLFLLAWGSGLRAPVDVYGPPPLEKMTRLFLEEYEFDIATRMADEGRPPLAPLIRPHEVTTPGPVFADDLVKVTCARNEHPPIRHSFAFRFDTPDRSIVLSGDTAPVDAVRDLARGADVLVHEALYKPYFEQSGAPQTPRVIRHILASHTDAEEAGRIAAAAGVKTLVLTHFVPSDPPEAVTDEQWMTAASRHFKGRVILGKDLMDCAV
jgi:ribonuclease BN (tRNA processing enzyme)